MVIYDTKARRAVTSFKPDGIVRAIALSRTRAVVLVQQGNDLEIQWYDAQSGVHRGTAPTPAATAHMLATDGRVVAYAVGKSIRVLDLGKLAARTVAKAASPPVGLTIDSGRLVWGENTASHGRVVAVSAIAPSRGTPSCARAAGSRSPRAGSPSSTTTPPSMNTTLSPTSRAKPISCVTTTIVIPSRASVRMTPRTSPTSSGSSAEVGSSNSISFGFIARARAIATRCCWPPESWDGIALELVGEPDALEQLLRLAARERPRHLLHVHRRLHHVLERRHVPEEVEALEHHPDLRALAADLLVVQLVEPVARLPVADEAPVHPEPAGVDLLQVVDAAEERRLPRARRPEDADDRPGWHLERDPLQHLEPAEALVHALGLHHRLSHQVPRCEKRLRRSRCSGVSGSRRALPRA